MHLKRDWHHFVRVESTEMCRDKKKHIPSLSIDNLIKDLIAYHQQRRSLSILKVKTSKLFFFGRNS